MKAITIQVDDDDYDAIQEAIARRQAWRCRLPGRLIAENCRGWVELAGFAASPDDDDREGEEWKDGPSGEA